MKSLPEIFGKTFRLGLIDDDDEEYIFFQEPWEEYVTDMGAKSRHISWGDLVVVKVERQLRSTAATSDTCICMLKSDPSYCGMVYIENLQELSPLEQLALQAE